MVFSEKDDKRSNMSKGATYVIKESKDDKENNEKERDEKEKTEKEKTEKGNEDKKSKAYMAYRFIVWYIVLAWHREFA